MTAVSITIVPAISESCAVKNNRAVRAAAEKSILFAAVTGFGAAGLFITLPDEISRLIYGSNSIGDILFMLGLLCPCMYLNVMLTGTLNGIGEQISIFINGLAGSLICLGCVWFIIPETGLYGYIFGSLFGIILSSGLNLYRVNKNSALKFSLSDFLLKPLLSAASAGLLTDRLKKILPSQLPFGVSAGLLCGVFAVFFIVLLILTGSVKKRIYIIYFRPCLKSAETLENSP
ncbi:MAG: polysaccharide biosynthesis C-terminal domain-containing protein [Clostridiales bacterium]|nr:polysaccharide biosynthesis C-terminal domain-containing protein [Clostridiales bacterium]